MSITSPGLYVVATPIGNLDDISQRAIEVLSKVDLIAAEDTRHSHWLLQRYGIRTPTTPFHEHNERRAGTVLLEKIQSGAAIALISDAGTPLLSDPGYHLVAAVRQAGLPVYAVPGPSALVAALSVSGLPVHRFSFEGFLAAKSGPRRQQLTELTRETRTLVCFESPHRIQVCLDDIVDILGAGRRLALIRELTKAHETVLLGTAAEVRDIVAADANQRKGEMVLVIEGAAESDAHEVSDEARRIVEILARELPLKQASALTAEITGVKKNALYQYVLSGKGEKGKG